MKQGEEGAFEAFVESVLRNLAKNGFPGRPVAFPIERLYESADQRGLNFNQVLEALATRGVAHEKTPERVIFRVAMPVGGPLEGLDLSGFDMAALQNMSPEQQMAAAARLMQRLNPEQLDAMRGMVEGMSPEEQARMIEQAKKLGLG